ncbi:class I SAM-dependent methyltransferase [Pacificimonas pallii]|uniref:class I SAM-dependent methyltransferase n=1 Tax=Pacificimonas pallii TaxID=2827236 RepID=UPI003F712752
MRSLLFATVSLGLLAACTPQADMAEEDMASEDTMAAKGDDMTAGTVDYGPILAGEHRSDENRARDRYRRPAETLAFFGLEPGMTVVEIGPGGGWYTEIIAPAVGPEGRLYAAHNDPASSERAAAGVARFAEKLAGSDAYAGTELAIFSGGELNTPDGAADMVLTFRNVHNWYMGDVAETAFSSFYDALKPGGVLGVVEHRLPETSDDELQKTSGYMKQSAVIAMAEAAGFKLVEASEINANPNDTADYPKGVWTLPPRFAEGETDRAKYAAIGESDRMTLKFVKPAA